MISRSQENEFCQLLEGSWKQAVPWSGLQMRKEPSQLTDFSLVRSWTENSIRNSDLQDLWESKWVFYHQVVTQHRTLRQRLKIVSLHEHCLILTEKKWKVFFFLRFYIHRIYFFFSLGLPVQHMEVQRLGAKSGLQLPAYTTATALPNLSSSCDLHHILWQHRILNPLSEATFKPAPSDGSPNPHS